VLLRTVSRDSAPTTRAAACEAIYRLSLAAPERVTEAVLASLDEAITPELGQTLRRLGQPALDRLLALITSSDGASVRMAIAGFVAMGQAGLDVVSLLKGLLLAGSARARFAVSQVLDRLGIEPHAPDLRAAYWLARGELERCQPLGQSAVPVLMRALPVYDWQQAGAIALSLVRLGIRPDHPALEFTLARLRLACELEDELVTQVVDVIREGVPAQQPVTLRVSHREKRRAARKLLAAIDRVWAEHVRRIRQQLQW